MGNGATIFSLPPSLGLRPPLWHQFLSPIDGLIIKTAKRVHREVLGKSIITIIIIISELGIRSKNPCLEEAAVSPGCAFSPESSWGNADC